MRAKPVLTPRNLARMPHYRLGRGKSDVSAEVAAVHKQLSRLAPRRARRGRRRPHDLRRTRVPARDRQPALPLQHAGPDRVLRAGQAVRLRRPGHRPGRRQPFCNSGIYNYDSFNAGLRVDGTDLDPFCVKVNDFTVRYTAGRRAGVLPREHPVPVRRGPRHEHLAPVRPRGQLAAAHRRRPRLPARPGLLAAVHGDLPRRPDQRTQNTQWRTGRPDHDARRGRDEVRPARHHRRGRSGGPASSPSPACSRRRRSCTATS